MIMIVAHKHSRILCLVLFLFVDNFLLSFLLLTSFFFSLLLLIIIFNLCRISIFLLKLQIIIIFNIFLLCIFEFLLIIEYILLLRWTNCRHLIIILHFNVIEIIILPWGFYCCLLDLSFITLIWYDFFIYKIHYFFCILFFLAHYWLLCHVYRHICLIMINQVFRLGLGSIRIVKLN